MQETKTNALGIRITDGELRRLEAIKGQLGLPSMTNTALGHDLLVIGIEQLEMRAKTGGVSKPEKRKARSSNTVGPENKGAEL
jgi:hypothetical protein